MENQHRLIPGYRDLNEIEVNTIAGVKTLESDIADMFSKFQSLDPRWKAIARTHFQQAFMAWVRAIAQPEDPWEVKNDRESATDS